MATSTVSSAPATAEAPPAKSKKKLIMIIGVVLLVAGAAYYMLVMKPAASAVPAAKPAPKAGIVVKLEPIYINLADGHFLKLGLALQGTDKASKELDGSKALDAAISVFSGKEMTKVADDATRTELKKELSTEVVEMYEDEVMDIYFTEFVMQ